MVCSEGVAIRFHLIKLRVLFAFWLQLQSWCSNLRVAEIPCFAGPNRWGGQSRGIFLIELNDAPAARRPHTSFDNLCNVTENKSRKEDCTTYGKWKKNVEDATHD